jgi:hypothetical protein
VDRERRRVDRSCCGARALCHELTRERQPLVDAAFLRRGLLRARRAARFARRQEKRNGS